MRVRRPLRVLGVLSALAIAGGCAAAPPDAGPFGGPSATVRAVSVSYDPGEISLPGGVQVRIVLDNQDSGVPHDVRVIQGDRVFGTSPVVTGPATTEVRFGPLTPARYQYVCTVHPNMIGTLVIGS